MAVTCSKCGEELLGAVNRCWRCGASIVSVAGEQGLPPVRRTPTAESSAEPDDSAATIADNDLAEHGVHTAPPPQSAPTAGDSPPIAATHQVAVADVVDNVLQPTAGPAPPTAEPAVVRTGSPFAASADAVTGPYPVAPDTPLARPLTAAYHQHSIAYAGAYASVILGLMSLVASAFTLGALLTAAIGMAMGIWGLNSNRRGTAILGLILCSIAIAIGSFYGVVDVYTRIHGHGPFETPLPPTPQ